MKTIMTRREFLQKSLTGAGLAIGISITPAGYKVFNASGQPAALFSPSVWIEITPDDLVTVIVNKSEMGQGVSTSLPMIIADELEADWKQVRFREAPAGAKYIDPNWGMQLTGGSTSIRHMYEPLRKAGAAAREMLLRAAAETWNVPVGECAASRSVVRHAGTDRSLTFGQLAEKASRLPLPQKAPLKEASHFKIIGTPLARLDVPDKVNGTAPFGIDVFVPDMLYGAIARPPAFGAKIASYEKGSAEKVKGVKTVAPIRAGIVVCADTLDGAHRGRDALKAQWGKGSHPDMNSQSVEKTFQEHLDRQGAIALNRGDAKKALIEAVKKVEAVYILPYLAHITMEPMDCVASVRADRCDVWVPTQNQSGVLQLAGEITGLKPEQIHVHVTYLGGGFGRRAEIGVVEEALQASKAAGKPVKIIWTREEDIQNDLYRPGNCCRIEGGLDREGNLIAWSQKIAAPSVFEHFSPQMIKKGIDPAAVEGIADMEYGVPNLHVEYVKVDLPIPVGFWRSVGNSHNGFTKESFIDEMAGLAGKDPVDFRLNLLKNNPRARRVVEMAAEKGGWGKPVKEGRALGMAHHFSFETHVAHVAEVSVDRKDGTVRTHKVTCVVDCGPVINPDIVTAQMKGALIMGLSAALHERIDFANGGVTTSNFHDYQELRMSDAPEIEVHIIESKEAIGGIGEPGLPPIAPAVANAVFKLEGVRLRRLPMAPERMLELIKKT
jgi:isoquinoline 1-oxidoreductase subunit beta